MRKIGVLTSGGDSPGMNAAVMSVARSAALYGIPLIGIKRGYNGLLRKSTNIKDDLQELTLETVLDIADEPGTYLRTARCTQFLDPKVREEAARNLKTLDVIGLVVIGGDGSYMGAKKLTEMGINCVGLPGTIDNDIASTDYTIGFDTCLNTIVDCVDKIRDTTESHQRCAIIEVVGNHCGDLALFSGIAEGAEMIITPDHPIPEEEVMASLRDLYESKKKRAVVIVSEKIYPDIHAFAKRITEETGFEAKAEVLGRVQRGGSPSAFDRVLAARMGAHAVDCLLEGKGGICVGMINNKIVDYDIYEALQLPRDKHISMLRLIDVLK